MDRDLLIQDSEIARLKQPMIHLSSQIQPHGILMVLQEPELKIVQVSRNCSPVLGLVPDAIVNRTLGELIDEFQIEKIMPVLQSGNLDLINPTKIWIRRTGDDYVVFDAVFQRNSEGFLLLELEPAVSQDNIPFLSFYHLSRASINPLEASSNIRDLCQIIVREVQRVTLFDRVMLYKFDDDQHGEVLAEVKHPDMESYLGLHFPESDIPKPARQLFSTNWIRLIPDAMADPVDLYPKVHPITRQPVDLTLSILRSAYVCHLEYLRNMGVRSSLTISLIKDQKLWGIIACHHRTPKYVSYELRKACEFLGRVIFSELSTREETADYDYRMRLTHVQSSLVAQMSESDHFIDGLVQHQPSLLDLTDAQGAAISFAGEWTTLGRTPAIDDLDLLMQWLDRQIDGGEIFYTDSLPNLYPEAERFKDVASGLLAVPISKKSYVLWFRPEVIQTVHWGGDPNKAFEVTHQQGDVKLCPRKSFALWKQTVHLKSLPWKGVEREAALELRKAIVNIVLKQADELAQLAHDLARSNAELKRFAYIASHDLQEPLNQVANYVQLLEMRYREHLDEDGEEFINFVVEGVSLMQTLIDDVLAYSKADLQSVEWKISNVETVVQQSLNNLRGRISDTHAIVTHAPLPTILADGMQLMQLFQNLIGNAIKFKQPGQSPTIHISAQRQEEHWLFSIKDNGIGIDPQFFDRIFVIFQRLHTRDEYPGTGMGLAICKKIVECHRGRIWVESQPGVGTTFYFTIPIGGQARDHNRGRKAHHLLSRR
jgi:chemotaxis family two-component system sensor kinase Cph1